MIQPRNILAITTSEPADRKIVKHLKLVTSHVVAGTNIFSDVFAGFSDIFGGRSTSYQKQLTSIYREAIERLQIEAFKLGADCIVGLKIDIDEISGQGKSMFMITAIGTAAISKINQLNDKEQVQKVDGSVSLSEVEDLKKKRLFIAQASEGSLKLETEIWEFLIANRVAEVYPYLMKVFTSYYDKGANAPAEVLDSFKNNLKNFMSSLDRNTQINLFYDSLENPELGSVSAKLIFLMIRDHAILDLNRVKQLLESESAKVQKRGMTVITYDKPHYSYEDVNTYKSLKDYIERNFAEKGSRDVKKQLLSSKEVDVWICRCDKENKGYVSHCTRCQQDIYGYYEGEINPPEALRVLSEKIVLLDNLLKDQNESTH